MLEYQQTTKYTQVISSCIIEARLFTEEITENKYLLEGVPSSFFFYGNLHTDIHEHTNTYTRYESTDTRMKKIKKTETR